MSFSWVCWISVSRGWVRWRWEEGQEESEVNPSLRSLAVACSLWEPQVYLSQQYLLQRAGAGGKHCQPSLWRDSLGMGLNRALSDIQYRSHRSAASSSQQQGVGLGCKALHGTRGDKGTGSRGSIHRRDLEGLKASSTNEWIRLGGIHPHSHTRVHQHPPQLTPESTSTPHSSAQSPPAPLIA